MVVARAHYQLNTLKWDEHFFVGVGEKPVRQRGYESYKVMYFQNGDRFIHSDNYRAAYLIATDDNDVKKCSFISEINQPQQNIRTVPHEQ